MAIKVNGTTVIDDSRNLSNVGGLKTVNGTNMVGSGNIAFKTVNGSSVVGSGNISAGASTTYGAVGTYTIAAEPMSEGENLTGGATRSGSNLKYNYFNADVEYNTSGWGSSAYPFGSAQYASSKIVSAGLSGTWRLMVKQLRAHTGGFYGGTEYTVALWVRIS